MTPSLPGGYAAGRAAGYAAQSSEQLPVAFAQPSVAPPPLTRNRPGLHAAAALARASLCVGVACSDGVVLGVAKRRAARPPRRVGVPRRAPGA